MPKLLATLALLCCPVAGFAEPPPDAAPPAEDGASRALEEELERALSQDRAAEEQPPPPPSAVARAVQSLNPDLSLIGDFAAAIFSRPDPAQLGGHDPLGNGFNLQGIELAFAAAVDPYFGMNANLAFAPEGFELEEAYATSTSLPWNLQVRAGQFLARFGRHNTLHPHAWDFADTPLVLGKLFGPEGLRGRGAEASVLLGFLPWFAEVLVSSTSAELEPFLGEEPRPVESGLDLVHTGAIRQFFPLSDDLSISWGLTAAAAPVTPGDDARAEIFGSDLYLKWRPVESTSFTTVSLTVEGLWRRRHDLDGLGSRVLDDGGGYATVFWRFDRHWAAAARQDWAAGVSGDPVAPEWTRARHRTSAALTFWPSEFSRLRLQGNYDRARDDDEPVWSAFLAFEFVAGAHGAHTF